MVHSSIEVVAILNTTIATFISLEAVALLVSKTQSYCFGPVVVEVQCNDCLYLTPFFHCSASRKSHLR